MARENQTLTVLFADVTESSRLYNQLGDVAARNAINRDFPLELYPDG